MNRGGGRYSPEGEESLLVDDATRDRLRTDEPKTKWWPIIKLGCKLLCWPPIPSHVVGKLAFGPPVRKKKPFSSPFPFCLLFHHYHHHRPIIQFCVLCRFKCWAPECSAVGLTHCCRVTSTTIFNVAFLPIPNPPPPYVGRIEGTAVVHVCWR